MARYKVLVCGGRDYANRDAVFSALDLVRKASGDVTVIQGGASGADAFAREWCALQPSVHMVNEPADWKTHGRAAGPIRNQRMLDEHKPDVVIAFAGGRGTADMVRRAESAGVPVVKKIGGQRMIEFAKDWCLRMAALEDGQEIGAGLVARDPVPPCPHLSYSQDKTTGECHCDDCGKLLIDSIGRVLE